MNGHFAQVAACLTNTETRACAIGIAFAAVKVVAVVVKCLSGAVCQMTSNENCEKRDVMLKCAGENLNHTHFLPIMPQGSFLAWCLSRERL